MQCTPLTHVCNCWRLARPAASRLPPPPSRAAQMLQPPLGVAYIAAKRYYFGVGGGTQSFRQLVAADGLFEVTSVACVEDPTETGGGNVREVLKLAFPESIQPYFF